MIIVTVETLEIDCERNGDMFVGMFECERFTTLRFLYPKNRGEKSGPKNTG